MAENSKIEWTDHTFNPWEGCQKAGPGCDGCYAEARNARFGGGTAPNWGPGAPRRRTSPSNWRKPIAWNALAAVTGIRPRVFCASLADVFDNAVDPTWRADLAGLILSTPNLDWLLLTKRIGNALDMLIAMFPNGVPANVRIGATIVNQDEAVRDLRKVEQVAVATNLLPFLSMEPLLGPVDLAAAHPRWSRFIGWVIAGGESGPGARPMHPDWARGLRDQCAAAGVPFFFKQWGNWSSARGLPGSRRIDHVFPDGFQMVNVGKKRAGRLLDGVTHDGMPA